MNIKKSTMRKIKLIWLFRQVFNLTTAKVAVIAVLAWQLVANVSIVNVLQNWSSVASDLPASYRFIESAVINTEMVTPLVILGLLMFTVLLYRDMILKQGVYGFMQ